MKTRPSSYEDLPWVLPPEEVAPLLNVDMCTIYELLLLVCNLSIYKSDAVCYNKACKKL